MGGYSEEVGPIVPLPLGCLSQSQVGFVNEGRTLKRGVGSLAP